jgi:DNA repair exonuclease SbcCD ATPase subunit
LPPLPAAASTVSLSGPTMSPSTTGPTPAAPAPAPTSVPTPGDGFAPLPTPVQRELDAFAPPPTRILRGEALGDRPFAPPRVIPIPEIPEPGLIPAARYSITFLRARFQRRGAIKSLSEDIKRDTDALDQILGSLGRAAHGVGLEGRVFAAENAAISAAETKRSTIEQDSIELHGRKAEENTKYVDVENDRTTRVSQAEHGLGEAQRELQHLEGQRRSLREKRKDVERRQRGYLKAAEQREEQVANAQMGDSRHSLRADAESHRRSAAELEPERQEIDRKLGALEKPIADSTAKVDAAKAELESARRSLDDAREGYGHRLAELEAEQKRKAKEVAQAEAEIVRRLVTLGTLVNLNRVDRPEFTELYLRIDRLRHAIGARTTEIDKLTAERDAYDKASLVRGLATIGGSIILLITVIVLLRACV